MDAIANEERAQAVLRCLTTGPLTARQISDALPLSPSATRVLLDAMEDRARVVRIQEMGEGTPRWVATELPT